jgi:23S rRNA pseudouridine1911/1915/1917 synthase
VHFAGHGFPLLGDGLYGGPTRLSIRGQTLLLSRPLLHALALEFPHPRTRRRLRFRAAPPDDFAHAVQALGLGTDVFDGWDPLW